MSWNKPLVVYVVSEEFKEPEDLLDNKGLNLIQESKFIVIEYITFIW